MNAPQKLKAALVGCRGIGKMHARAIGKAQHVELVAACDLDVSRAQEVADMFDGVAVYLDYVKMLEDAAPDIVALALPTSIHATTTIRVAESGVKGIYGEKPLAVSMAEGRAIMDACRDHSVQLVINHQRRTLPAFHKIKSLIDAGAIGDVYLIRGTCAGDVLSDGTHLIDSILYLAGDAAPLWVFGSIYRLPPTPDEEQGQGFNASGGYRYGHAVETGGLGTWEFPGGLRAEILTGSLRFPGRPYNDYEIVGTAGRLWRKGDSEHPNLYIQAGGGGWEPIDLGEGETVASEDAVAQNYDRLAENIRVGGGDHPLSGEKALRGLEIVMAIYESARLRTRIDLPLKQGRFPLAVMIEEGMY
jgi:predicted dehydrogenase